MRFWLIDERKNGRIIIYRHRTSHSKRRVAPQRYPKDATINIINKFGDDYFIYTKSSP
ncbi:MAG: hypothetical protein ACRCS8_00665 [Brevinema sp.]